jgi:hypothetical protein
VIMTAEPHSVHKRIEDRTSRMNDSILRVAQEATAYDQGRAYSSDYSYREDSAGSNPRAQRSRDGPDGHEFAAPSTRQHYAMRSDMRRTSY